MDRPPKEQLRNIFESEVVPLTDKLYRYALRILKDPPEAQDVVQDVLVKVWERRTKWSEWKNMEAMSMTITRNLAIDRSRGKHRHTQDLPEYYDEPSLDPTPGEVVESGNAMEIIEAAMNELPIKQKEVIHLREVEGHTYSEIAEILDIPMSQVKVNLHRARIFLRQRLNRADFD